MKLTQEENFTLGSIKTFITKKKKLYCLLKDHPIPSVNEKWPVRLTTVTSHFNIKPKERDLSHCL